MTVDEMNAFIKIKDRHEYFTRDDIFKERNDFEQECLFEIGYLTQIIEKLKKENEELKNKVAKRNNELIELEETAEKEFLTKQEVKENYIPKDKISELIKEPTIITSDGDYISVKKVKKLLEEE